MYHVLCKRSKMDICFLVLLIFIMCKKSEVRIKKKKNKKNKSKTQYRLQWMQICTSNSFLETASHVICIHKVMKKPIGFHEIYCLWYSALNLLEYNGICVHVMGANHTLIKHYTETIAKK